MIDLFLIYMLNLAVVSGMFIVTIYRAWIEKQNLKAIRKITTLRAILESEKEQIENMTGEEFIDMLKTVLS